jgi:hypothetical protein
MHVIIHFRLSRLIFVRNLYFTRRYEYFFLMVCAMLCKVEGHKLDISYNNVTHFQNKKNE